MTKNSIKELLVNQSNNTINNSVKKLKPYHLLKSTSRRYEHQNTLKKMLNSCLKPAIEFLNSIDLGFGVIPIIRMEKQKRIRFNILNYKSLSQVKIEKAFTEKRTSSAKDKILLSDKNYENFRVHSFKDLPSIYYVRKHRHELTDSLFKIFRNDFGNYVNCKDKIKTMIEKKIKNLNITNNTIQVKLCADGTNIGRAIKILNFCFTLPGEGNIAKTASGNYSLGIFKINKEDYSTLRKCLYECAKNLSNFSKEDGILIQGQKYKIEWYLGGDMKFIHAIMGLNSCNSKHSCFTCKMKKEDFYKPNKHVEKRTIEDHLSKIEKSDYYYIEAQSNEGYLHKPIFDFITYENVVFDTLHLLLRITGKLIKLALDECITLDNSNSSNLDELPHQKRYYKYLEEIGINNPYTYEKNEKEKMVLKMRSLNGQDCLKVLEKMDFQIAFPEKLFPNFTKSKPYSDIYKDFYSIFIKLKENFYKENPSLLEKEAESWLKLFTNFFPTKHVTPYMHLFSAHLCFFVELHGDVDIFNAQGIEKLNDQSTMQYYKGTNKKGNYLYQMLALRNRHEEYRLNELHKVVKKRPERPVLNKIRQQQIINAEKINSWYQYKFNDFLIKNTEIISLGNNNSFPNVIYASFFLLKKDFSLIISSEIVEDILNGKADSVLEISLKSYRAISGFINIGSQWNLLYISLESKKIYWISCEKENEHFNNNLLKNWKNISKLHADLNLNGTENWEIGKFRLSKKDNLSSQSDLIIIMSFSSLVNSKESCKSNNLNNFKDALLDLFKDNSSYPDFCSCCGLSSNLNIKDVYECQCTRKFHKECMHEIYKQIYKYESYKCFFCRNIQ